VGVVIGAVGVRVRVSRVRVRVRMMAISRISPRRGLFLEQYITQTTVYFR